MRAWRANLLCVAVLLAAAYVLGRYAAAQDLAGERVLHEIDPLFAAAKADATVLRVFLVRHLREIGVALSAWWAFLVVLSHAGGGRRAWPMSLALTALLAAAWGEIQILRDDGGRGALLLGGGFALAVLLGALRSMARTPGFPAAPDVADDAAPPAFSRGEILAVLAVLLAALLVRTYALNEMPKGFDGEELNDMISSRTLPGWRLFFAWNFLANSTGALQLLSQCISYHLFGTSIFALRYSAAVLGSFAVFFLYALVRRLAGSRPALLAAVLAVFAPEQLYWSRSEVTQFMVAVVAGLVTLLLCQWLLRRLSLAATLVAALWMPFSRLLYIAGWVLFALPPVAALHSLLLGRNRRLKALYVLPLLALGVALWGAMPTLARWALVDTNLPIVSPINVYGHSFVMQQGELHETSAAAILGAQVQSIVDHTRDVAVAFFDGCTRFTHWYNRGGLIPAHVTLTDAALAVWAFCGLFYLLGQPGDPRAVLLWALVGLGAAPALMSPIPFARRMLLVFVALPIAAALFAAAIVRLADQAGAHLSATLLRISAGGAALLIAATSAQSYFMMPMGKGELLQRIRFARPLFAESDAIFHNLSFGENGNLGLGVAFGNLDTLLARDVDFQFVDAKGWLPAALRLQPRFQSYLTRLTLTEAHRADLAAHRVVENASFLLQDLPVSAEPLRLLSELYPHARRRRGANLVAISVSAEAAARRRVPRVFAAPAAASPLAGFASNGVVEAGAPARVDAALLIEDDGWYRWSVEPACAGARLTLDGRTVGWGAAEPLLRGAHAFDLTVPETCPPLEVRRGSGPGNPVPLGAADLFAPAVADLPAARARAMEIYDGFTAATPIADIAEAPVDFALDPSGGLAVLTQGNGVASVVRFDATGARRSQWPIEGDEPVFSIAVAADGTHAVLSLERLRWYSPQGTLLKNLPFEALGPACDMVFWGRDRLLVNHPGRNSILVFDAAGKKVAEWKTWPGLKKPLLEPWALAADGAGRLFLRDSSLRGFLVSSPMEEFRPHNDGVFAVDAFEHGATFAPGNRIVVPAASGFEVFRADGTRLVARDRARDLGSDRFGRFPRAQAAGNVLYTLDTDSHRLWRVDW